MRDATHQMARLAPDAADPLSAGDRQACPAALPPSRLDRLAVAPIPLPPDHSRGLDGPELKPVDQSCTPTIHSMSFMVIPHPTCACDGRAGSKPILTMDEAAGMMGVSRKRIANLVSEEKARLGRLPGFVCDAQGRMRRRLIRDEFLEWVKARRTRRGRPPKGSM